MDPTATTNTDNHDPNKTLQLEIPEAVCGKVANVVIWESAHWDLIRSHVPIGTFIRLRNVDVKRWNDNLFRCKYSLYHH